MATRGIVRRRWSKQAARAVKRRPQLELLEDRTLLNNGNWLAHINGLPGDTRAVQTAAAQTLIEDTGLNRAPVPVNIVDHVGADGILWIRTPADADLNSVQTELQVLPGFDYVEDYNPNGPNPNLRSWFQQFEGPAPIGGGPPLTGGPDGSGAPTGPSILTPGLGFDGIDSNHNFLNAQPPDTIGAAGPSSYIETVNTALAIYNKTNGAALVASTSFTSFFSSLGGELNFSDPVVTYDEIHQRFVVATLDYDTVSQCRLDLAISRSNNPTTLGSADWDFFRYNVNDGVGGFDFGDYPKLGYNADGYVFSFNMFPNLGFYDHVTTLAVRYSDRAGFLNVVPGGFNRFTFAPATVHGASPGDPMWFVEDGHEGGAANNVTVVKETNVFSNSPGYTFTPINELASLGSYSAPPRAPQQGGGQTIDTIDARFYFSALRNVGGTTHLIAAHTVGTAGVARVRWYDFDVGGATPTRIQEGEINQGAGVYTFLPSLDMNANGAIGMTFGQSAANQYWSMYVTGRSPADALGTMQTPVLAKAGTVNSPDSRAGDYSFVNVDPSNNTTFWAANEYAGPAAFWTTWIQKFDVSSPAGPFVTGQTPSGTTLPAVHDMTVSFSVPVNVSGPGGFDTSKITNLTGPASYSVDAVTAINPSGGLASSFDVHFAGAGLTVAGDYSFHLGPNITDANGNPMDQDQDGPPPGQANDYYLATLTVGRPAIVSSSPTGTVTPGVAQAQVTFNEPILVSSFDNSKITSFTRNGTSILGDISAIVPVNPGNGQATTFNLTFTSAEVLTGVYSMVIGPNITDPYGNAMAAAYTAAFNIDGPKVTALTPSGSVAGPVSSETVTFSRAMLVSTFTAGEVTLKDPNNTTIAVAVTPVNPSGGAATQFTLSFAPQTASGVYTTTLGPDIQDTFGNKMDQDGNFVPGEPGDKFTSTFTITQGQSGNLIVNPGFETGTFSGWTVHPDPIGSYFGVSGHPHSGRYAAYFGSYWGRDDISQNVPTVPGHTYHISYWVANDGGGSTEIRSSWGGAVLEDLFPSNAFPYQQHAFDVVATATSTEFRIGGYQLPAFWYLDDVSVTDTTTSSPAGPFVTGQTPSGTALPAVTQVQVSFNVPVHVSGDGTPGDFDASKITQLGGPASFAVSAVNAVNPVNGLATTFNILFAGAGLTVAGNYSFHLGPNITDANGNPMDQDQDGPPLGQANDYYLATLTVGRPVIVSSSPTGTSAPVVPKAHVTFNEPVLVSSFDTSEITAFTRNGANILGDLVSVVPTNQAGSTASQFDINFAAGLEKATGVYSMTIGPNITDSYGNAMASAFTTSFNIDGPKVTAITPTGVIAGPVSSETVTFSRAMLVSTFTAGEVTLKDPNNTTIAVAVTPVNPSGGAATQFTLSFAPQTASGVYTTTLGPDIQDTFGNAMDQNGNFVPGEPGVAPAGDQFQSTFNIPQAQAGNLIVNPGFETGNFSGWLVHPDPIGSYFGVSGHPHSGNYAAYFGSYWGRDDIYQNVPTVPGHTYHISYWVANDGGGYTEIRSSWGGTVLEDLFPNNAFPYQQHTFDVVATSTSTQFRIGGYQWLAFWYLDDVSVTDTTITGTFGVVKGTDIANGNIVADAVFAAAAPGPMTADGGSGTPVFAATPGGGGRSDSPTWSIPGASRAAPSRPFQGLDAFFAAFTGDLAGGAGNAGAAGDLLAAALASRSPTPTVIPAPAAMTPATAATPPSLSGGTGQVVPPPTRVSGTLTSALPRPTAHAPADEGGTNDLTLADLSWDGEAATWRAG
jgi:hypothetical protein